MYISKKYRKHRVHWGFTISILLTSMLLTSMFVHGYNTLNQHDHTHTNTPPLDGYENNDTTMAPDVPRASRSKVPNALNVEFRGSVQGTAGFKP